MIDSHDQIVIPARFNGPPSSANGGYAAGSIARLLDGSPGIVQVTLRQPPPLDVAMLVSHDRSSAIVDGSTVLEAKLVDDTVEAVDSVPYDVAVAASTGFTGFTRHPFPTCFACGPDRAPGDGLRIFPGMVDAVRAAAPWIPDESLGGDDVVDTAVTWAALDCVSGWARDVGSRPMVLGRMACVIEAAPRIGEPHVAVGRFLGADGRKNYMLATLYDSDDRIVARAGHIWVEVDPADFTSPP